MTESVAEAQLKKTDAGLIPQGEGGSCSTRDVSDMDKLIEMGMLEGLQQSVGQIDALLAAAQAKD
jgi:hypothetical protein